MNSIPKINIGKSSHRNKFDLSCMCHTTSEVGYMQPMFSRILNPHTTIKVSTKSLVRLSNMFVPTMGKLDLRLYHAFVPINTIWTPFDAFLTGTDFTLADGSQYRPVVAPNFRFSEVWSYMSYYKMLGGCPNTLWNDYPSGGASPKMADITDFVGYWLQSSHANYNPRYLFSQGLNPKCKMSYYGNENGFILANANHYDGITSDYVYAWYDDVSNKVIVVPYTVSGEFKVDSSAADVLRGSASGPIPEKDSCDWSLSLYPFTSGATTPTTYTALSLFSVRMRRLRKAFLGLGYAFNPFDTEKQTPFKLMAYYKAWYQLFYPQRDSNFFATNCYKLTKYLSENGISNMQFINGSDTDPSYIAFKMFIAMLDDLCDIRYILPLDYYSLADPLAETRGATTGAPSTGVLHPYYHLQGPNMHASNGTDPIANNDYQFAECLPEATSTGWSGSNRAAWSTGMSALGLRAAMKLMRFINKNTVVGKKVTDILRMRFGVSDSHEQAHEAVYLVGSSKVDISISDVMANATTEYAELGEYAGKGIGFGESKYFTFDSGANTGVFVTFASVVPLTGYFQGMLRENSLGVNDRFDFYSPEYDACGYDDVKYNELVADMMRQDYWSATLNDLVHSVGTNLGSIGYVPRYTSLKVAKDICNGDISLYSRHDSMLPYTLDRYFAGIPDMTPENFRSLNITDFNRIFNSKSTWDDHFIIQTMFDVSMWADMKSIANTFDTFDDDGDTDTIEMEHQ